MLDSTRPDYNGMDLTTVLWDHETGETWAQALERFQSLSPDQPLIGATEVADLDDKEVWSFGYGDDPEGFDGIDPDEVRLSIAEDGTRVTNMVWGPFLRMA